MAGGSHIVAVGPEAERQETAQAVDPEGTDVLSLAEEWADVDEPTPRTYGWVLPSIAFLTVAAWTGFFLFAHSPELRSGVSLTRGGELLTSWSVPVLLVLALWLTAMRSSSREAARFGNIAHMLSQESTRLEQKLIVVNRELSLAREFIAAQSRDLESLGRMASQRLSKNAGELQRLVQENSAQIESIATVSSTALENMDKLRGELPVIANSTRDVASQIGNAGRTAHAQLEDLVSGFHRLNEFGEASERQVAALRVKVDAALTAFESQASRLDDLMRTRFEQLSTQGETFRTRLESHEVEALAAVRRRADALEAELDARWNSFEAHETAAISALRERLRALQSEATKFSDELHQSEDVAMDKWKSSILSLRDTLTTALAEISRIDNAAGTQAIKHIEETKQRLAELDSSIAERQEGHLVRTAEFTKRGDELAERLSALNGQMDTIFARGSRAGSEMAQAMEAVSAKLAANENLLQANEAMIAELTDSSVRLLELIQASSEHSREKLPQAITVAEKRLSEVEARTKALDMMLGQASNKGEALSNYVLAAQENNRATFAELDSLQNDMARKSEEQTAQIADIKTQLAGLTEESDALSKSLQSDLGQAVARLHGAITEALGELGSGHSEVVEVLGERIGAQSAKAVERAIREHSAEAVSELEQTATQAAGTSREAVRQLRDQLAKVAELASNLETRVARAKERAQEQVDNDFARRVALITESLNSNAIDISKALSNEVTDTAWASYLRGDRGIFTRRAVRLLENSEAREIAEIYDRDNDFREHVSRYIHDFEAMLRTMLSTRDGNALSVTLLSSDMGKLYVVLAQAIDRLRD